MQWEKLDERNTSLWLLRVRDAGSEARSWAECREERSATLAMEVREWKVSNILC